MGYAVDYKPKRTRARRQVPKNKAQRTKDLRQAIRWNLGKLEHDTTGTDNISRDMVIQLLRLNKVAPGADPSGDHTLQQLIGMGVILKPTRRAGVQVFDRADLLTSLKAWAGVR
ncbi:hypothetical protein [Bifidobacterium vansinderenii]|uniref:Uncharacterized protein n=1 Tax=Bifidobacterium vansinderenii TaxID=1984871 RepID=A0A229VZS3_9BIFI|nr:hypothetical protein [Bifidobacterium vansinderenii]OXN01107.1 hypothetical protein Tam10B_0686 [Bifidobacterium vansinderenii]